MRDLFDSVIHLRDPLPEDGARWLSRSGVESVLLKPAESALEVRFDADVIDLAAIVRTLTDRGASIISVAQHRIANGD